MKTTEYIINKSPNILYEVINCLGHTTGIIGTYRICQYKFKSCINEVAIVTLT